MRLSLGENDGIGRLTFDLVRAHEGQRCGEARHDLTECGGVSIVIVVGRWYYLRLQDVGCGWSERERERARERGSNAGYLCSTLAH